jgi:hypothetical protein
MAIAVNKKAARKKPVARPKASPAEAQSALYLYAISLPGRAGIVAEAVDGTSAIEALPFEGLTCWISRVDRAEFAERLAENMENLEWLATVGVRHQRAVAELAAKVEILPARFGTVFLSELSLHKHVADSKKLFQSVLKKIAGSDEWGVKVFRVAQNAAVAFAEAASGTDYLKRKAKSVMPKTKEEDPALAEFVRVLMGLSVDTAPGGKASSGQPGLSWHGSFLVRRGSQKKFAAALRTFTEKSSEKYRVEVSGPWPPYSFVGQHG